MPTLTSLAEDVGVSRKTLGEWRRDGCPVTSAAAVRRWAETARPTWEWHQETARMYAPSPAPDAADDLESLAGVAAEVTKACRGCRRCRQRFDELLTEVYDEGGEADRRGLSATGADVLCLQMLVGHMNANCPACSKRLAEYLPE